MQVVTYVMLAFAVLGAIDRIFGSRIGIGKEFEKGVSMLGPLMLSMGGMLILAPVIAEAFIALGAESFLGIDISIIPASLLANDMGAAHICALIAGNIEVGLWCGLVVASMMGCTVSFTLPYVMQVVKKEDYNDVVVGLLIGMITVPVGCIIGGIVAGTPLLPMLITLIPLVIFLAVVAIGILKFEKITVKIFLAFGWLMRAVIAVGLIIGAIEFMLGITVVESADSLMSVAEVLIDISCIMMGAFPLLWILKTLLSRFAKPFGRALGINEASVFGLIFTLGSSVPTFASLGEMDRKGVIINSAFTVSASFVFVDHLAYTMSFDPDYLFPMIAGKLVSGISAVILAIFIYRRKYNA